MAQIDYFLGANTPGGFYALPGQPLDPGAARAVYILKGGAGCGKSSLMKTIARRAEERGEPVWRFYCSGDPDSLDGLVLPNQKTALVDGTAPHVAEPTMPAAIESYVNLGDFYDAPALREKREEIGGLMEAYRGEYRRAYRCLKAAGQLLEDGRELLEDKGLREKMEKRARGIAAREIPKNGPGGAVTERFLSAVTCRGRLCLYETVDTLCKRVYALSDPYGLGDTLLRALLGAAAERGWPAVACRDPMAPGRLEHLLLPELGVAFVTGTPEGGYPGSPYRRLRLEAMVDRERLRENRARLRFGRKVAGALLEEGMETLARAKALHDELEAIYNPHVDFGGVYALAERLGTEILGS